MQGTGSVLVVAFRFARIALVQAALKDRPGSYQALVQPAGVAEAEFAFVRWRSQRLVSETRFVFQQLSNCAIKRGH
jgi:hypothetical protein